MQPAVPQQAEVDAGQQAEEPALYRPFRLEEEPASPDGQAGVSSRSGGGEPSCLNGPLEHNLDGPGLPAIQELIIAAKMQPLLPHSYPIISNLACNHDLSLLLSAIHVLLTYG